MLDAFVHAFEFYDGVPKRVIIDNPKTMVTYVSRSKDRIFHPRFLALMNHYVNEPIACTPASGWEKGQVENQVQHIRKWLFTPKLKFDNMQKLNEWLYLQCIELWSCPAFVLLLFSFKQPFVQKPKGFSNLMQNAFS